MGEFTDSFLIHGMTGGGNLDRNGRPPAAQLICLLLQALFNQRGCLNVDSLLFCRWVTDMWADRILRGLPVGLGSDARGILLNDRKDGMGHWPPSTAWPRDKLTRSFYQIVSPAVFLPCIVHLRWNIEYAINSLWSKIQMMYATVTVLYCRFIFRRGVLFSLRSKSNICHQLPLALVMESPVESLSPCDWCCPTWRMASFRRVQPDSRASRHSHLSNGSCTRPIGTVLVWEKLRHQLSV